MSMCSLMQANPPSLPVPTKALQTENAESVQERMRLQNYRITELQKYECTPR